MIIERLKKLREDILNRGAESKKRDKHLVILREVNKYFETHSTENKMFLLNRGGLLNNFDEEYAMSLDIGRPYIIKKQYDRSIEYLEVTYREEYRPDLYY